VKVLLATDGEAPSEAAGSLLGALADPARVQAQVLAVNGFELAFREAMSLGHYSARAGQEHAERAAQRAVSALSEAGLEAKGSVVEGDEATEILRLAEEGGFELVVMGTGKERWVDTVVLGSVSSSVLHACRCPVLVVHTAPSEQRPLRVLVGTDGSEGATRAVRTFAGFADPTRCTVEAVSVVKPSAIPHAWPARAAAEKEMTEEAQATAAGHVNQATATLEAAGFEATGAVVRGNPAAVLTERAVQGGYDLVVVGARGLGRFRAKVLGSVSDRIVRHARASLIGR
jgi:nucleotide-binding universal stress UspA family protein